MRLKSIFIVAIVLAASAVGAQDFTDKVKPTCELAKIVARPAEGWFNVPIESPRPGHLGCQMMRTNDAQELVGVLRIRSVTAPAAEFGADNEAALVDDERKILQKMNIEVGPEPLWTREKVPLKGAGFREARGGGYPASIDGNPVPHEVHFLTFRAEDARYLVTLITPSKRHDEGVYKRNTDDFGVVIRSLVLK